MRPPKGINTVRKRLANGEVETYHYAWKGGPRLRGKPGTPQFQVSYDAAVESAKRPPKNQFRSIIDRYLDSLDFGKLAESTKKSYLAQVRRIEAEFGDLPIAALGDRRVRGLFLEWRDRRGRKAPRQADMALTVLARIISWAFNRGDVPANPCTRPGRLYNGDRSDRIWTADQEAAFYAKAPEHLHLALTLALWTGQRQGDLLKLRWSDYDGARIPLKQGKRKKHVPVPVGKPLRLALDAAKARLLRSVEGKDANALPSTILTTIRRKPWTGDGFRTSWRKACEKAEVVGVTFHDLRGTAVVRLARAGCSVPEIAAITGHSLADVEAILSKHYLGWDVEIAENAIRKLEKQANRPTKRPTKRPTGR
jgi:integrase